LKHQRRSQHDRVQHRFHVFPPSFTPDTCPAY
jgi:hypothetical protein